METSWTNIPLTECGTWLSGGTPSKSKLEYWHGDIPWVSPKDMNEHFIRDAQDHISSAGVDNGSRLIPPHTILFVVRSMTLAHKFQLAITERTVAFNQDLKAIVCKEGIYPYFLFYSLMLQSNTILQLVDEASHGTKRLRTDVLQTINIHLPSLEEQRTIAHFFKALDDKIELNRQMNETLEGIARALFQSWFVDFDPVRAKMAGRQPYGMDAETAALFTDGFEDSVLGEIPRRWRIGNPQDIADITMGQSPPGEAYNELGDGLPFYQGIRDFGFRFPSRRVYCNIAGRMAEKGDVLLSVRAPVGSLNIALERSIIGRGIAALRAKSKKSSFLYYLLNQIQPAWDMFNAGGTVFGSVSRGDIQKLNIKLPPIEIERRFNDLAEALDCRIELNENEIATLTALRDTLLPKLLSGELRVGEAEKEVGAIL